MTGGRAATNTLRERLQERDGDGKHALALVETALDAADRVLTGMTPLRSLPGAVGTIGTEDLEALAAALRAVREGT